MEDHNVHTEHRSRLDRLESIVDSLATNSATTNAKIDSMADMLKSVATRQTDGSRTQWGVLISAGALVITLVSVLGIGFVGKPLGQLYQTVGLHSGAIDVLEKEQNRHHAESRIEHRSMNEDMLEIKSHIEDFENNKLEDIKNHTMLKERILSIERDVYSGSSYRSGRITRDPK